MATNSGVLIRHLLGNGNNPCAVGLFHRRKLLIQNLTAVPSEPSSPQTIDIRSASKPFSFYSPHTPNLQFLQQRRCLSSPSISDSDSKDLLLRPSNLFVIETLHLHYEVLEKVEGNRLSAVFYYTAPGCEATCKWVAPIFDELCEQFPRITIYKVYMDQNSPVCDIFDEDRQMIGQVGNSQDADVPLLSKGGRIDEIAGASIRHLKKRLENVYNPSGRKKRRIRGTQNENDGGDGSSELVEVRRSFFPQTSMSNVIFGLEENWDENGCFFPLVLRGEEMWWFAKGMFSCQKKREEFCKLENSEAKLKWLKSEFAKK